MELFKDADHIKCQSPRDKVKPGRPIQDCESLELETGVLYGLCGVLQITTIVLTLTILAAPLPVVEIVAALPVAAIVAAFLPVPIPATAEIASVLVISPTSVASVSVP